MWRALENDVEIAPSVWVEEGEVDSVEVLDREEGVMGDVEKALKVAVFRVMALLIIEFRAGTV